MEKPVQDQKSRNYIEQTEEINAPRKAGIPLHKPEYQPIRKQIGYNYDYRIDHHMKTVQMLLIIFYQ